MEGDSWKSLPDCFGLGDSPEKCGKCDHSPECFPQRLLKNQEEFLKKNGKIEGEITESVKGLSLREMVKIQHKMQKEVILMRLDLILNNGLVPKIIKTLENQGLSRKEAIEICKELI